METRRQRVNLEGEMERYCQLDSRMGLFSVQSGEEEWFLGLFFIKNHPKNVQKFAQWGKLIKEKL
jgi:hypothetical protein